ALNRAQHGMQRAIVDSQLEAASLEAAKLTRSRRSIAAPISGIVSRTFKHVGQWVEAGEPVLQLTDLSNLMVDQSIPIAGNRLVDLVGKEVRVRAISQLGHEIVLAGYIASYDHVVSARGEVRVHVRIPNRMQQGHWLLLPGMNCTLFLPTTTATNSNEAGLQPNSVTKNQVHGSGLAWNRK
ncbi:MAG: HlyD family efflux transporter periplasmic adaptor subunit, partial [Planctomycetota bacterium]